MFLFKILVNVQPGAIMTQRTGNVVSTQSLPIAKVIAQGDQNTQQTANVFIHTPVAAVPRRTSPGENLFRLFYIKES